MKKSIIKLLTVTLAAATLTGMTALPVFATNPPIVNQWVGSDAVEADQEHGIAANPGTAITTKQTITVTNVDDKSESLQVTAYQLVKGTYKDGKLTGYVLCDPVKARIADWQNLQPPKLQLLPVPLTLPEMTRLLFRVFR